MTAWAVWRRDRPKRCDCVGKLPTIVFKRFKLAWRLEKVDICMTSSRTRSPQSFLTFNVLEKYYICTHTHTLSLSVSLSLFLRVLVCVCVCVRVCYRETVSVCVCLCVCNRETVALKGKGHFILLSPQFLYCWSNPNKNILASLYVCVCVCVRVHVRVCAWTSALGKHVSVWMHLISRKAITFNAFLLPFCRPLHF